MLSLLVHLRTSRARQDDCLTVGVSSLASQYIANLVRGSENKIADKYFRSASLAVFLYAHFM